MHAYIFATTSGPQNIPQALLPIKGRSVIDYLLDDMLGQKDITTITILTTKTLSPLLNKHVRTIYGDRPIEIEIGQTITDINEDVLICQGALYSSLKMQDLIRAFKQHKTAITPEYQKDGKSIPIPHCIIPKQELPLYSPHIGEHGLGQDGTRGMRVQNMGTGFCYEASSLL